MEFYTSAIKYGSNILYRGYKDGSLVEKRIKYRPFFYEKTDKETSYKDIHGTPVAPREFSTMGEAYEYSQMMKDVDNYELYGYDNYVTQFLYEAFPQEVKWRMEDIAVVSWDVEVKSVDGFPEPRDAMYPITTIALKNSKSKIYHVWGTKELDTSDKTLIPMGSMLKYHRFDNEEDMLLSFISYNEENRPDIFSGWNIEAFDIPYVINRIIRLMGEKEARRISPWKLIRQIEKENRFGGKYQTYKIYGIETLDYMDLFLKFGYTYGPQESYSLDNISSVVLGDKKVEYKEYESLDELYEQDFQTYVRYNIKDVFLVEEMERVTGFIELALTIAYLGGVNYTDALGSVAIWESIIYRHLMAKNIVFPPRNSRAFSGKYEGAFVRDPQIGKHEWVATFDLNSLYPMTITAYNIGPETLLKNRLDYSRDKDFWLDENLDISEHDGKGYSIAANNCMFRTNEQSFLGELSEKFYDGRKITQREMRGKRSKLESNRENMSDRDIHSLEDEINQLDNIQHAMKILLNSLYGCIGMPYFYFHEIDLAEAITKSGQVARGWAENIVNRYLNQIMETEDVDYAIMGDTDSVYFSLKALVDKFNPKDPVEFVDKVCQEKIEPLIDDGFERLMKRQNAFKNTMKMGRENISDVTIIQAKKRYIMNVVDDEGVRLSEPKIIIKGIEAVKSSTPKILKKDFDDVFHILLFGKEDELHSYMKDAHERFLKLPPEDISFPRGITDIEKWQLREGFMKGTPIHVRGGIVYNRLLDKHKLPLERIKNGTKVKFTYLIEPNPTMSWVVSFTNKIPQEFGLQKYIDYETQFEKSFESPVEVFAKLLGWTTKKINTIEELFI